MAKQIPDKIPEPTPPEPTPLPDFVYDLRPLKPQWKRHFRTYQVAVRAILADVDPTANNNPDIIAGLRTTTQFIEGMAGKVFGEPDAKIPDYLEWLINGFDQVVPIARALWMPKYHQFCADFIPVVTRMQVFLNQDVLFKLATYRVDPPAKPSFERTPKKKCLTT